MTSRADQTNRATPASQLASVLSQIDEWGADHAAAAVVGPGGNLTAYGDGARDFRWASLTKLVTAFAVLVAVERGMLTLDEAAGPPGSTVRHLLAHASGLPFEGAAIRARPGRRRTALRRGPRRLDRSCGSTLRPESGLRC